MKVKLTAEQWFLVEDVLLNAFYGLPVLPYTELSDDLGKIIFQIQEKLYDDVV